MSENIDIQDREAKEAVEKAAEYEHGWSAEIDTEFAEKGLTVVMITHDLDSLYSICDRAAVVADRKIVEIASIPELEQSGHPWIKDFFAGRAKRAKERNC